MHATVVFIITCRRSAWEERKWRRSMEMKCIVVVLLLMSVLQKIVAVDVVIPFGSLKLHYYKTTNSCRYAEEYVKHQVGLAWKKDRTVTASLLRLVYSDCFVTGCDGSILLDGPDTEKMAPQNYGLKGFDVIDRIKKVMEAYCPGVVSCSDILHLAAKEAVALAGAPKYPVFTGRRDAMVSSKASVDLPSPSISWTEALQYFQSRGLDVLDLGTLLGAHSLGKTRCSSIYDRLYNYNNTGTRDPTLKLSFFRILRAQCPKDSQTANPVTTPFVYLNPDSGSSYNFSNSYYSRVLRNEAVLGVDQQFIFSRDGIRIADEFSATFEDFRRSFALAMYRMGSIGVLTGSEGEIRKKCRFANNNNPN